ncbi:RHS repeat domain-containing protein [Flindersiella endophytica]
MRLRVSDRVAVTPPERERPALERLDAMLRAERRAREAGEHSHRYDFDANGDLRSIVEADGRCTSFGYDEQRRLSSVTDCNGLRTCYRYDDADRLTAVDDGDVPHRFTYDSDGRLSRTTHGRSGGSVYRYTGDGRLAEARAGAISTSYAYADTGSGAGVTVTQTLAGVGISAELSYDADGRLCELRTPGGHVLRHRWEAGAWSSVELAGRALGNGLPDVAEYDKVDHRPLRVAGHTYEYTADGRLATDGKLRFGYDDRGRLSGATGDVCWQYDYDATGDRVLPEPVRLSYDRHGRVVHQSRPDGDLTYRYDDAGQLVEVRRDSVTVGRMAYDHAGRLALAILGSAAERTERYLYAPDGTLLAVTDENGAPVRIPVRTPHGLLAELTPEGVRYLRVDHIGTVHAVTGESGELLAQLGYGPFGEPLQDAAVFGGRTYYPELGLYDFGARWYDPALGRFLTPDNHTARPDDARLVSPFRTGARQAGERARWLPAWLNQPALRDRYAFCGNDPVNRFDPDGHWSFGWFLLSLLGAIWTLPNTLFGMLIEITCLISEPIRWILSALGTAESWQAVGFDAAASGNLNAFALVFIGGWMGTLGDGAAGFQAITFGNVFFLNRKHTGTATSIYEHELRHTNQYGWFGPLYLIVYLIDIIANGYDGSWLEGDAFAHEVP